MFGQEDVRETITNTAETSVAFNLDYASYNGYFDTGLGGTQYGLAFSPNGKKMYSTVYSAGVTSAVNEYDLTTAWDIKTVVFNQQKSVTAQDNHVYCVFFKPDGLKMFVTGQQNTKLYRYDLTTAWDISTAVYVENTATPGAISLIFFRPDGKRWFGCNAGTLYEYDISTTPWVLSSSTFLQSKAFASITGCYFSNNGSNLFTVQTGTSFNRYTCSIPYNMASATLTTAYTLIGGTGGSVFFKENGAKFFILEWGGDRIHEYSIKRSWR